MGSERHFPIDCGGDVVSFDPDQAIESHWGVISIRFNDCGRTETKMSGLHGEQTLNLVKLDRINTTESACYQPPGVRDFWPG